MSNATSCELQTNKKLPKTQIMCLNKFFLSLFSRLNSFRNYSDELQNRKRNYNSVLRVNKC